MNARPNLRAVIEGETGQVFTGCPRCEDVQLADLENAEKRIRKLEREKKALQEDKQSKREAEQATPEGQRVLALIDHWRVCTGHPKANLYAADRYDMIKARLREGYTHDQIELAIEGLGAYRYVGPSGRMKTGKPDQRHDRLGIALGGGEDLERLANLGYKARKEREEASERSTQRTAKAF